MNEHAPRHAGPRDVEELIADRAQALRTLEEKRTAEVDAMQAAVDAHHEAEVAQQAVERQATWMGDVTLNKSGVPRPNFWERQTLKSLDEYLSGRPAGPVQESEPKHIAAREGSIAYGADLAGKQPIELLRTLKEAAETGDKTLYQDVMAEVKRQAAERPRGDGEDLVKQYKDRYKVYRKAAEKSPKQAVPEQGAAVAEDQTTEQEATGQAQAEETTTTTEDEKQDRVEEAREKVAEATASETPENEEQPAAENQAEEDSELSDRILPPPPSDEEIEAAADSDDEQLVEDQTDESEKAARILPLPAPEKPAKDKTSWKDKLKDARGKVTKKLGRGKKSEATDKSAKSGESKPGVGMRSIEEINGLVLPYLESPDLSHDEFNKLKDEYEAQQVVHVVKRQKLTKAQREVLRTNTEAAKLKMQNEGVGQLRTAKDLDKLMGNTNATDLEKAKAAKSGDKLTVTEWAARGARKLTQRTRAEVARRRQQIAAERRATQANLDEVLQSEEEKRARTA